MIAGRKLESSYVKFDYRSCHPFQFVQIVETILIALENELPLAQPFVPHEGEVNKACQKVPFRSQNLLRV